MNSVVHCNLIAYSTELQLLLKRMFWQKKRRTWKRHVLKLQMKFCAKMMPQISVTLFADSQ